MNPFKYWFESDTLRQKLLRWVLAPMVILFFLNILWAYQFGIDSANHRHDRFLYFMSRVLLDQLRTNQDGQVEFIIHSGAMDMLTEDIRDPIYYSLRGSQQDYQFGVSDLPAPPGMLSETPSYYFASYAGHPVRMMAAIMPEADVASGRVVVMVGQTLIQHREWTLEWTWRVLPSLIFMLVFAGGMVWWGVGRGLRPLMRLRDEVANRSLLDLSPLPEEKVVAEVRPLIRSFNQLMGRLDESLALQRRFIADAAHQLRTPLAGLKAQAELALCLNDETEIRHSLNQMHSATDHAAHLVNQLLVLARAEPDAQNHDSMAEIDLPALARKTAEYWAISSLPKEIDFGFESIDGDCHIFGNALLLSELLNNLIDNAFRYTQHGGKVTVRIARSDAEVALEVEDNGPGIPENEREQVFKRFYRVLGTNQDGCGLGLSIVREIAHRHNAEVRLMSGAGGIGTLVRITFHQKRVRLSPV